MCIPSQTLPLHNCEQLRSTLKVGAELAIPHPYRPERTVIKLGVITSIEDLPPHPT